MIIACRPMTGLTAASGERRLKQQIKYSSAIRTGIAGAAALKLEVQIRGAW